MAKRSRPEGRSGDDLSQEQLELLLEQTSKTLKSINNFDPNLFNNPLQQDLYIFGRKIEKAKIIIDEYRAGEQLIEIKQHCLGVTKYQDTDSDSES